MYVLEPTSILNPPYTLPLVHALCLCTPSIYSPTDTPRLSPQIKEKRLHVPLVDRLPDEPPPRLVTIVGPPGVGKTTLLYDTDSSPYLDSIHSPGPPPL